ncbi:MAG: hypothetical protein IJD57_06325 [Candidatus Gastranaerophilales bacterium]|nr:hypothetical protein [Candidatus Gastranaerophilales bacterium]
MKFLNMQFFKSVRLSFYFAVLMSLVIIITTTLFAFYTMFNIKNLASEYESDNYKLRYSISTMLVKTFLVDNKKKDYEATLNIVDIMKKDNLLSYVYVKDNKLNKIIIGQDDYNVQYDQVKFDSSHQIKTITKTIGDYTVYIGIPIKDNLDIYYNNFFEMIVNILTLFIVLGIVASVFMSSLVSKPLEKLLQAAKEITDGNFDVKIENTNFTEINDLIYSYNEMGFQLNELYNSLELKVQERTMALEAANYKLQETQAMMVHSEKMRSLGELTAGIAHEINNPVNFIHGNIMILQNYADDLMRLIELYDESSQTLPDEIKSKIKSLREEIDVDFLKDDIKDLIKSCIEGTQRTKNIVLDLKNFSRMEEMILTQFDIPKEIDTTLNILNNKYKNRITVVKNYAQNLPKIEAYGGQLNQVFMNILDNAQGAMKETGTLTINAYKETSKVKIEFIDTGCGIAPENLKKVFDPFFTTKAPGEGTGLGMSISYRVINDHNGTIEVESEVGKGTKFIITLPINHDAKEMTLEEEIIQDLREENGVQNG